MKKHVFEDWEFVVSLRKTTKQLFANMIKKNNIIV